MNINLFAVLLTQFRTNGFDLNKKNRTPFCSRCGLMLENAGLFYLRDFNISLKWETDSTLTRFSGSVPLILATCSPV